MRKIAAGLFMSLVGVVEGSEKWGVPYNTGEAAEAVTQLFDDGDTALLGRSTYEMWSSSRTSPASRCPLPTG
jgi:hypothetical protein